MTPDLDTVDLTSKIKDILQFHNLGQKLFGEAVLGLSQGSVSELLSKPKPWSVLSIKGKEPFVRMLLWLNDPYNIEKLKLYQTEAKANRRRKSSVDEQRSCETPIKRPRVFFTEEQKETLRTAYANDPYPNQNTIEALANGLNVGVKTVVNWFHNHRMRAKQVHHTGSSSSNSYDYNPMSVKSEAGEDNSNLSDGLSTPGDTPGVYRQGSGSATEENSQWLFPQFEPVRRPSPSEGQCDDGALRLDLSKYGGEKEEVVGKMEDGSIVATSAVAASGQSGVKKRKSSQPKRVYEGTQLEKTHCQGDDESVLERRGSSDVKTEEEELATINNNNKRENEEYGSSFNRGKSASQSPSDDSHDESVSLATLRKVTEAPEEEFWSENSEVKSQSRNEADRDLKEDADLEAD